eukprot:1144341-Pelagomonas_calceolata.AAC.1
MEELQQCRTHRAGRINEVCEQMCFCQTCTKNCRSAGCINEVWEQMMPCPGDMAETPQSRNSRMPKLGCIAWRVSSLCQGCVAWSKRVPSARDALHGANEFPLQGMHCMEQTISLCQGCIAWRLSSSARDALLGVSSLCQGCIAWSDSACCFQAAASQLLSVLSMLARITGNGCA